MAARVAHNHEVAGSSPAPATTKSASPFGGAFFVVMCQDIEAAKQVQIIVNPQEADLLFIVRWWNSVSPATPTKLKIHLKGGFLNWYWRSQRTRT